MQLSNGSKPFICRHFIPSRFIPGDAAWSTMLALAATGQDAFLKAFRLLLRPGILGISRESWCSTTHCGECSAFSTERESIKSTSHIPETVANLLLGWGEVSPVHLWMLLQTSASISGANLCCGSRSARFPSTYPGRWSVGMRVNVCLVCLLPRGWSPAREWVGCVLARINIANGVWGGE